MPRGRPRGSKNRRKPPTYVPPSQDIPVAGPQGFDYKPNDQGVIYLKFRHPDLNDFWEHAASKKVAPEYKDYAGSAHDIHATPDSFTQCRSLNEAASLMKTGWPEGRAKMVKAMSAAQVSSSQRPAFTMDMAGAYPIASLAAAGDPLSMVRFEPDQKRHKPIVRLTANITASAAYGAEEFMNYGAAMLSYIDGLESAGYRVELSAMVFVRDNLHTEKIHVIYNSQVILKQAQDRLEIDRIAFCLVHPGFFRRLYFAHIYSLQGLPRNCFTCCGSVISPKPERDLEDRQLVIPNINSFKPRSHALSSPQAAVEALAPILDQMLVDAGMPAPKLAYGWGAEHDTEHQHW